MYNQCDLIVRYTAIALTSDLSKNMIIDYKGEPHLIVEKEFYKPGKGGAYNRTKLKNLKNGSVVSVTFKSTEKVDELSIERKTMNFLYVDADRAYFMDPDSYEQIDIPIDLVPQGTDFLHTEGHYIFMFYNDEVILVEIPLKLALKITDTSDAVKGNTSSNATKDAILETGLKIQVPLFINNGDLVSVNTESKNYVSKA